MRKFERFVPAAERERFARTVTESVTLIANAPEIRVCRDASDDRFLALAQGASAKILVSGDRDLLSLHPFGELSILSPADFLAF